MTEKTSSVKIPTYVFVFFLALPLVFDWNSGFFYSLATVIAWVLTLILGVMFCIISILVLTGSLEKIINNNSQLQKSNTVKQIKGLVTSAAIVFLIYSLGHENLSFFYLFFVVTFWIFVRVIRKKVS